MYFLSLARIFFLVLFPNLCGNQCLKQIRLVLVFLGICVSKMTTNYSSVINSQAINFIFIADIETQTSLKQCYDIIWRQQLFKAVPLSRNKRWACSQVSVPLKPLLPRLILFACKIHTFTFLEANKNIQHHYNTILIQYIVFISLL